MEDLIENFSKHINKLISSKLGSKIRNLARAKSSYKTDEDYAKLESNIQLLIESYLSNLKDNDYKEIANNIFNSFIEEDDNNLIKAVNFYKRTYEYYQEMNLRKKFYKWRKTAMKLKMINNFIFQENYCKNQSAKKINLIKENDNKIPKFKKESNTITKTNNIINNDSIKHNENISNFNNNQKITYEINSLSNNYNMMDENNEDFINSTNNYNNNEKYHLHYDYINDDNNDYKEEFSEELDYNKLLSKNKYI